MTNEEMGIFIAEIRSDIKYLRERMDDRFKTYDKHIDESPLWHEKTSRIEEKLNIVWVIFVIVVTAVVGAYFKR